ncbi:MAG: hypothetical protein RL766_1771, partial [Bacteroidota bacterium]
MFRPTHDYRRSGMILILLSCILTFQSVAQDRDISSLSSGGKLHPLQANMDIRHYTISLDIDISKKEIKGYTDVDVLLENATDTILLDLINFFKVSSIVVNGKAQNFAHTDNKLYIYSAAGFQKGKVTVRVNYSGEPPVAVKPPWTGGFTWTKDRTGNPWVAINC